MYCGGKNSSISQFFKDFSLGLDQHLLSKKIVSKLKVSVIRQTNTFSLNNWKFLTFYIVSIQFPGILGNSRTDFREIPVPEKFREIFMYCEGKNSSISQFF